LKLHEFQSKALMRQAGIPVPEGEVAESARAAQAAAATLARKGYERFAVKAQVHAGGRGKGGGIKLASSPKEAGEIALAMLGSQLVTPQTGPAGVSVRRVLIEGGAEIANELYLAITVDRARRRPVIIASSEGGMDIEEVAATRPECIHHQWITPGWGLQAFEAAGVAYALGLKGQAHRAATKVVQKLARLFADIDASLTEINPLIVTPDDEVIALDAKIDIDDNALFRHQELAALRDPSEEDELEAEAAKHNLSYISLDGTVGCMVNGAGLAMATMDEILLAGGSPANFLDVGGGASVDRVAAAFKILLQAPELKSVLINIFGGIVRCDRVAKGIIEALETVKVGVPVVVRLQGTNAEEGRRLLQESSLDFIVAETLDAAAREAVGEGK
jgi:succinyl-CoA synthetase beta subunit